MIPADHIIYGTHANLVDLLDAICRHSNSHSQFSISNFSPANIPLQNDSQLVSMYVSMWSSQKCQEPIKTAQSPIFRSSSPDFCGFYFILRELIQPIFQNSLESEPKAISFFINCCPRLLNLQVRTCRSNNDD